MKMVLSAPVMRMGHSEGHTDVCYDESGKYILTCGTDGDIRVWHGLDDDDPQSIDVGESTAALALSNGRLYSASDANTVQAYTFPEGQSDGIITRFTAPVSHISLSQDGQKLVAAASDFNIKVVDLGDSSQKVLEGHTAPVLSIAADPLHQYVASSSCDGTLKIWNLDEQSWEKSSVLIPKCSDVSLSKTLCRMDWKPRSGEYLAVPLEKKIEIYERSSWDVVCSLEPEDIDGFISVVSWSPCGQYLATANTDGTLCFWDIKTKKCVERSKHKKGLAICGLAWNPKVKYELAFTDVMGQVGVFEDITLSDDQGRTVNQVAEDDLADLFDDAADEDLLEAVNQATKPDINQDELDALIDDDDDDEVHEEIRRAKQKLALLTGDAPSLDGASTVEDTGSVSGLTDIAPPVASAPVSAQVTPMQKPFIPASTPIHLSSRFMKWNSVGIIRCYDTDDESSIDVEFHDTAIHHSLHFDNQNNYTMADLSTDAVLLASESNLENPSLLMCHHFLSWDNQKEWSTSMPKGENIKGLAIGGGWIGIGSDKRLVRLYSTSGIQREIFSLPGPIICMAGYGKQLMVAYHAGVGVPGDQCIGVKLLTMFKQKSELTYEGQLPMSPKTTLTWIGFTAEGTAASADSGGVVQFFNRRLNSWTPVAHTKNHTKSHSDSYWIVGVHERQQLQIRCIACRGATFPPTLPRPTVTILPIELPLCELNTEKGQMEETYWRLNLMSQHLSETDDEMIQAKMERDQQDNLMKLFALACRSEREVRAYDVCNLMTSHQSVSLAIKYASRSRRMALAQRLSEMASRLMDEEEDDNEEEDLLYHSRVLPSNRRGLESAVNGQGTSQVNRESDEESENREDDGQEDEEEEEMETVPTLNLNNKQEKIPSLLPSSQGRRNPFKKQQDRAGSNPRGTNVFDEMKKKSPETKNHVKQGKTSNKMATSNGDITKQRTQATLFTSKTKQSQETTETSPQIKKKPSTFNFWLSQNRDSFEEENPQLGASEIIKLAMQTWKNMSDNEKKEWEEKAAESVTREENLPGKKQPEKKLVETRQPEKKRKRTTDETEKGEEKRSKPGKPKNTEKDSKKQPLTVATNAKLASFAFNK